MLKKLIIYTAMFGANAWAVVQADALPIVQATVGSGGEHLEVTVGTALSVKGEATDTDGKMHEHWLEIQNPEGVWTWEGWLTSEPYGPTLAGDPSHSVKSGSFTFTEPGYYLFRSTALADDWVISNVIQIHVNPATVTSSPGTVSNTNSTTTTSSDATVTTQTSAPTTSADANQVVTAPIVSTPAAPAPTTIGPNYPWAQMIVGDGSALIVVAPGTKLTLTGIGQDADGDMKEHWLEIQNPAGQWSWEGWLTGEPFAGALVGDGFKSVKTTQYTFDQQGTYHVRTTVIDPHNDWQISNTVAVIVDPSSAPAKSADASGATTAASGDNPAMAAELANSQSNPIDISAPATSVLPTVFKADGSIDVSAYKAYFTAWDKASASERLGPTFDKLNPGAADDRPTVYKPKSLSNWMSFSNRTDPYELGPADGPAPDTDYWSESGQVAYVPDDPVNDPGLDRIEVFAYYNNVFAISPRLDWATGSPHPDPQTWDSNYVNMIGHPTRQPVAMVRGYAMIQNEALVVYQDGLLAVAGTQTSREDWARPYPGIQLPAGKVPTGIAITASNEFALITIWDTNTQKGQLAVVALEGKYIAYHTWPYMGLPNQGSWSDMKLLGFVDLPMHTPSSVSVASNGWWQGPSQTAGESFSQIDLSNPWTRAGFLGDDPQWSMVVASKGYAVVASKLENKAVIVDLTPLFNYVAQSYLSSTESYWNTVNTRGSGPGQWPLTFAEKADSMPTVAWQSNIASPSSVLAGVHVDRWSMDRYKAYVASEDGTIHIVDTSPLMARYDWETLGTLGEMGTFKVGRNPVYMALARFVEYGLPLMPTGSNGQLSTPDPLGNQFWVACRGDRELDAVITYQGNGTVYRRIKDSRMGDPVGVSVAGRGNIVSVTDYAGRKLLSFRIGDMWDRQGRRYGCGPNGTDAFEFGGEMTFLGSPFAVNSVNVN